MKKRLAQTLLLPVILALFVPMISYTVFQFTERSKDERFISSIYDRQLKSILFSVNQHCWDVFRSWVMDFSSITYLPRSPDTTALIQARLAEFAGNHPFIKSVLIQTPEGRIVSAPSSGRDNQWDEINSVRIKAVRAMRNSEYERMIGQARSGYVKPMICDAGDSSSKTLLFPIPSLLDTGRSLPLAALTMKEYDFIMETVARKFSEMDDGNFIFAVERSGGSILYCTDRSGAPGLFDKKEKLWLMPDLNLLVKLHGSSLGTISRERSRRNLYLLVFVNIVLIAGLYYVLRSVGREVELARLKTEFVANVSHELRTPLSLISMHVETLEMGRITSEEKRRHYYAVILNESRRLTQLVNTILDYFRIESRRKEYERTPGDLCATLRETLRMYEFHFKEKGFELESIVPEKTATVEYDKEAVELAVVNLLDNAMKFSPGKGKITVSVEETAGRVIVSVKDRGIGIPENEHRKIFEKFYRVGDSLVRSTRGSGLGLSLVKHIMESHGGMVNVKSKPCEGSTFSLHFPALRI